MSDLPSLVYKITDEIIEFAKEKLREIPQDDLVDHLVPVVGNLVGKMAITMFSEIANCADKPKELYLEMSRLLYEQMIDEKMIKEGIL